MQRNWEVVRAILVALESQPEADGQITPDRFPPHAPEVVSYHIHLLAQAGLVAAEDFSTNTTPFYFVASRLTWAGHELLDAIRREAAWSRIKKTARDKGLDLSFEAIKQLAAHGLKQLLE